MHLDSDFVLLTLLRRRLGLLGLHLHRRDLLHSWLLILNSDLSLFVITGARLLRLIRNSRRLQSKVELLLVFLLSRGLGLGAPRVPQIPLQLRHNPLLLPQLLLSSLADRHAAGYL